MKKLSNLREKFGTYDKLRMNLKRSNILNPGKVARILLEVFVTGEVKISADFVEKRRICGGLRGDFAAWREQLISTCWLRWDKNFGYQPGVQLVPFVNQEKLSKYAVATTNELEEVKERVSNLEKVVQSLIEEYDPPYTKEKAECRLKIISST